MSNKRTERFTLRLSSDEKQAIEYWSKKRGMSLNEYIAFSIEHMIRYENKDYDLPVAEIQRLNQLIDVVNGLVSTTLNLEKITTSGFNSLLQLTRGDNAYLEDDSLYDDE